MRFRSVSLAIRGALAAALAVPTIAWTQEAPPPPRDIPGITADDPFPNGCVSCHVVLPDGMDVRLSALLTQWTTAVDTLLLAKAQSAAPAGLTLAGKHPNVPTGDIPRACMSCHGKASTMAPPFSRLLHRIHLTGEPNIFLSMFQGECTHCHKLDKATGAWSIASGPER